MNRIFNIGAKTMALSVVILNVVAPILSTIGGTRVDSQTFQERLIRGQLFAEVEHSSLLQ
jgi:hypothetical protein